MDQQALTRGASQRAQACGRTQVRPVGFGRILHGQDKRRRVEATIGRLYMTLENIVGRNVIVGKKARLILGFRVLFDQ